MIEANPSATISIVRNPQTEKLNQMPSTSQKQQGFMGAELARKRAGKSTKTKMSLKATTGFCQYTNKEIAETSTQETVKTELQHLKHNVHEGSRERSRKSSSGPW